MKLKLPISALANKVPNKVTAKVGLGVLTTKQHSPTILFGAGVVGIVATVVMASRATLKVDQVIDEHIRNLEKIKMAREVKPEQYTDADYRRETLVVKTSLATDVIKLYGPAVVVGIASVCALSGSQIILHRRNLALTAAYKAIEKGFEEYRDRIRQEFGEEKEREIRYAATDREIVEETKDGPVVKTVKTYGDKTSPYAVIFDEHNRNWTPTPEYNLLFLKGQQNYFNDLLHRDGFVILNDVLSSLGFDKTKAGCLVGWTLRGSGDHYIDFGVFTDRNMEQIHDIMIGREKALLLDFNVDGVIYDKVGLPR